MGRTHIGDALIESLVRRSAKGEVDDCSAGFLLIVVCYSPADACADVGGPAGTVVGEDLAAGELALLLWTG